MSKQYEMVIGLEVHIELKTKTKIFCSCPTAFGAEPNTHICPVCLGYPGTLPVLNRRVVEYAVKAGMATGCRIARVSKLDRKNYFYPDLPKAYQISQYDLPLCYQGGVTIRTDKGEKTVRLTRIHIEEDAGKLVHDESKGTRIDVNRCGVPLIEIVSEPDIRSADEAVAYLKKLRAIMLYLGVSDCRMQEGSMRCDVNLSVREAGSDTLGTRTEMKNLNSFRFVAAAIESEFKRQVSELEAGRAIVQETLRFDPTTGKTSSMRSKEDADDYRYFPDPDLVPIRLSEEDIARLKSEIPELPDERKARYQAEDGLTPYEAEQLVADKRLSDYFDALRPLLPSGASHTAASLLLGELPHTDIGEEEDIPLLPAVFASVITLLSEEQINSGTARKLFSRVFRSNEDPVAIVDREQLRQVSDPALLESMLREAIDANPRGIADYKKGKTAAIKSYLGAVMAKTSGRANPVLLSSVLDRLVEELTREG